MREDIVYRLRKRAEIRRQISTRKSVQEGQPDRIADLLEEAAKEIEELRSHKCEIKCSYSGSSCYYDSEPPSKPSHVFAENSALCERCKVTANYIAINKLECKLFPPELADKDMANARKWKDHVRGNPDCPDFILTKTCAIKGLHRHSIDKKEVSKFWPCGVCPLSFDFCRCD